MSHETIYRSLFVQARGVLKKELTQYLRTRRTIRRSGKASRKGHGKGQIEDMISIRERPASVEDRAVPGHWEGDLIAGSRNTYIATLVERHSRYVMLAKVPNKKTETVVNALIEQAHQLPTQLYKSLTWDRGLEMADHKRFTLATNIAVYFCDPRSPWQRGSNENTKWSASILLSQKDESVATLTGTFGRGCSATQRAATQDAGVRNSGRNI